MDINAILIALGVVAGVGQKMLGDAQISCISISLDI